MSLTFNLIPTIFIFIFIFILSPKLIFAKVQQVGLKPQLEGEGRYGYAGCGFGSFVFEPKENQLFAMTLNHITSSQAFGIMTGTSNCKDPVPQPNLASRLPEFIENNKDRLAADASRGNGESIKALSSILACKESEVASTLKENYKQIFQDTKMQPVSIEAKINLYLQDNQGCLE